MSGLQATLKGGCWCSLDFWPIYREDREITAHELLVHESGDILDAENSLLEADPAVWNEDIGQE
jgi:hypothetical protein